MTLKYMSLCLKIRNPITILFQKSEHCFNILVDYLLILNDEPRKKKLHKKSETEIYTLW